jgi:ABC-type glycerol-3-phosphate transport system substrate-binding protein
MGVALCAVTASVAADAPSGDVTITSWRYADPSAIGKLHYKLVDDFNASQDRIKVTAEPVPYPDVMTKLVNAVLSGSPPELTAISPSLLPSVAKYLEPLDDYWAAEGDDFKASFDPSAVGLVSYDGHLWGVPIELSTTDGMFYNKDILAAAGVDPEEAVSSWDAFTAALDKIKATGKTPMLLEGKDPSRMDRHWSWYVAGGADLTDPARYVEQMCNADAEHTFEFLTNIALNGQAPNPAGIGYAETTRQFAAGDVGFYTDGPWGPVTYAANDPSISDKIGYTHLPPMTAGGKEGANVDGLMYVIPKGSKNPSAAWEFMKFMASPAAEEQEAETGNLPTLISVRDSQQVAGDPVLSHFAGLIAKWGYPRPRSETMAEFRQIFITGFQSAVTGQQSAKDAHASACDQLAKLGQ